MRQLVSSNGKHVVWWDVSLACLRMCAATNVSAQELQEAFTVVCLGVYPTALRKIELNASGTHLLLLEDKRIHIAELPEQCLLGEGCESSIAVEGSGKQGEKTGQAHTAQCSVLYEVPARKAMRNKVQIRDAKWMLHTSNVGVLLGDEQFILFDIETRQAAARFSVIEALLSGAATQENAATSGSPHRSELARSICGVLGNRVADFEFVSSWLSESADASRSEHSADESSLSREIVDPLHGQEDTVGVLFALDGGEFYIIRFSLEDNADDSGDSLVRETKTTVQSLSFVNNPVGGRNEALFDDLVDLHRIVLLPSSNDALQLDTPSTDKHVQVATTCEPIILVVITRQRSAYHFLATDSNSLCLVEVLQFDEPAATEKPPNAADSEGDWLCHLMVDWVVPGRYYALLCNAVYAVRVAVRDDVLRAQQDASENWSRPSDVERMLSGAQDALACGACVLRDAHATSSVRESAASNYFHVALVTLARNGGIELTQLGFPDLLLSSHSREQAAASSTSEPSAQSKSQAEAIDFVHFVSQYLDNETARANRVCKLRFDPPKRDDPIHDSDMRKYADMLKRVALTDSCRIQQQAVLHNAIQQRRSMLNSVAEKQRSQLNTNQTRCIELCHSLVRIFSKQARVTIRLHEAHARLDRLVDVLRRRFDLAWRRDTSSRATDVESEVRVRAIDAQKRAERLATAIRRVADKLETLREMECDYEAEETEEQNLHDTAPARSAEQRKKTKLSAELNRNNMEIQELVVRVNELSAVVKQFEGEGRR